MELFNPLPYACLDRGDKLHMFGDMGYSPIESILQETSLGFHLHYYVRTLDFNISVIKYD